MSWPVGTEMNLPMHVLAEGLKGHKFFVRVAGKEPGDDTPTLVVVTGEFDERLGLAVKAVKPDA